VTHQIQFIQKATKILVLTDGQCLAYGSYEELQQMGIDFMSLLAEPEKDQKESTEAAVDDDRSLSRLSIESSGSSLNVSAEAIRGRLRTISTDQESFEVPDAIHDKDDQDDGREVKVEEEQYQRGSIK